MKKKTPRKTTGSFVPCPSKVLQPKIRYWRSVGHVCKRCHIGMIFLVFHWSISMTGCQTMNFFTWSSQPRFFWWCLHKHAFFHTSVHLEEWCQICLGTLQENQNIFLLLAQWTSRQENEIKHKGSANCPHLAREIFHADLPFGFRLKIRHVRNLQICPKWKPNCFPDKRTFAFLNNG